MGKHLLQYALVLFLVGSFLEAGAQVYCPANINFEAGNLTNWSFDTAINGGTSGIISANATAALTGRHTLTSGTATDYYGGFPIVDPVGGAYSLKLGNDQTGAQVERARYTITVPATVNNYSLIYRYAVVLENPAHNANEQPFFKVRVYNAATNATINCASFTYVSTSGLPGFSTSSHIGNHRNGAIVYYKPWATGSLNLTGQAGNTLIVEFTTADCSLGAHMGYGYVDMSCGLFAISASTCNPTSPLTAPPGFQSYTWYNSTYTSIVGTGQSITVPTPSVLTQYHVVLTPYAGYGCPDTLTTQIVGSSLAVNAGPDTMLCNNSSIMLNPAVTGNAPPYSYAWSPAAGLSCTSCLSPTAAPAVSTNYVLSVTDTFGCSKSDTVNVKASPVVSTTATTATCYGSATGSATALASLGTAPYTYSWNTTPVQTGPSATGLGAGNYTVIATDNKGCTVSQSVTIGQPPALLAAIVSRDSVSCNGGTDGRITGTATGGTGGYTFSWNTTPSKTGTSVSGLSAGVYMLTVADSLGCTDTERAVVAQPLPVSALISITNVSCSGGASGAVLVAGTGGTAPYTYAAGNGAYSASGTLSGLAAGTYTIHIKDAHGCVKDTTLQILQPAPLSAAITPAQPLCYGDSNGSLLISGVGGTPAYQYAIGNGAFGSTAAFPGLAAGTYPIHLRDGAGCVADTVYVLGQPSRVKIAPSTSNVRCKGGASGAINLMGSGGTPGYTYAVGTGAFSGAGVFSGLIAGSYIVHLKDQNGCVADSQIAITEPSLLLIAYTATLPLCNGAANGTVMVAASGGSSPYSYALNTGAFSSSSSFSGLSAGSHVLHIRDANGCVLDSTILLTQPAAPVAAVTTTSVACNAGKTGAATARVTGGTAPYSYSWTGLTATTSSVSGLGAGNYTVTVTDLKGCTSSATAVVTQPAAITVALSATAPVCSYSTNGIATATVSGGTSPYTYAWATAPIQTGGTATNLASGTYTLTTTDAAGCSATRTITVPTTPAIGVSIASFPVSCNGGSDGFVIATGFNGSTPYGYQWSTIPVQTGDTARGLAAGTYTVTVTSAAGCTGSGRVTVTEPQPLSVAISSRGTCPGFKIGTATAAGAGGNGGYSYRWLTVPNQTTAMATGLDSGRVDVIVTDGNGCKDTASVEVEINAAPVVRAGTSTDTVCRGSSVRLTAAGAETYAWSPAGTLSCSNCESPAAAPLTDTTYTVIGTDQNGCKDTSAVKVFVMQHLPVAVGPSQTICQGDSVRLAASGGISWYWLLSGEHDSAHASTVLVWPSTSTVFRVAITENRCFTDTLEQAVQVLPAPEIDLGPDVEALIGAVVRLKAEANYASRITWTPADGLSCSDCYDPQLTVRGKAIYAATVYNELGCSATDTVRITDVCDEHYFYFANMFTPNGDGNNDRFYPQGAGTSKVQHFMIYDRWGEIVFSAVNLTVNDPLGGWDGTYKGQPLKPDVYVFVMDAICESGKKVVVRGDVTLIR